MYGEPVIKHEILNKHTPVRHGLSTAEAALGRVGRVGVGEHDLFVCSSVVYCPTLLLAIRGRVLCVV